MFILFSIAILAVWTLPTGESVDKENKVKYDSLKNIAYEDSIIEVNRQDSLMLALQSDSTLRLVTNDDSINVNVTQKNNKVQQIKVDNGGQPVTVVIQNKNSWKEMITWILGSINSLILIFMALRKFMKNKVNKTDS